MSRAQKIAEKLTNEDLIEHVIGHDLEQSRMRRDVMGDAMDNIHYVADIFQKMALKATEQATRYITSKHNLQSQELSETNGLAIELIGTNEQLEEKVQELEEINESCKEQIREVAEENNKLSDKVDDLQDKVGDLEDELMARDKRLKVKDEELKAKDEELKKIKALWQKLQAQVDQMKVEEEEMFGDRYKVINKALGKIDKEDLEAISDRPKPTNVFASKKNDQQQSPKKLKKAKKRSKSKSKSPKSV